MLPKIAFIKQLQKDFPELQSSELEALVSENLLSPFTVRLPKLVLDQAQKSIQVLFNLRENKSYQASYQSALQDLGLQDPGNKSICMSYDFHVTPENQLKLIEVNTNASFLALGYEMYRSRQSPLPVKDFSFEELRKNIETELQLQGHQIKSNLRIAIIDEEPESQRLYAEFLIYQEFFKKWGWSSKIVDSRQLQPTDFDFIYNRTTDFFFEKPEHAPLKAAFLNKKSCFSPNPYEYFLLADKQRMIDWSQSENLQNWNLSDPDKSLINKVLPLSVSLEAHNQDDLWSQRKNLFIKPKRAFGSKQSYRGASISRRIFEELVGKEFIAQEFAAPSEQVFETPEGPQSFKFDLRCYAYQGRLQSIVARLYQGQVTNLRTPFGGFACVEFY